MTTMYPEATAALDALLTATLAPREAALRLGLSTATVGAAVHHGRIPVVRVGRAIRVPVAWVEEREQRGDIHPRPRARRTQRPTPVGAQ